MSDIRTVLFSIPVHERPEIVRDQIRNIKAFCPDSVVCLHVSRSAGDDITAYLNVAKEEGALVNPNRLDTGNDHSGIFHVHCSNFCFVRDEGVPFYAITLLSSNELLIRTGLEDFIQERRVGCQTVLAETTANWHLFRYDLLEKLRGNGFLQHLGVDTYFGGQAEGQFYRAEIFEIIAKAYTDFFPSDLPPGFEAEEIIPPTVIASLAAQGANISAPITLCDYCHDLQITSDLIMKIRGGRGVIYALKFRGMLASPHVGWSSFDNIFSVKRVPREECELRKFIRDLGVAGSEGHEA